MIWDIFSWNFQKLMQNFPLEYLWAPEILLFYLKLPFSAIWLVIETLTPVNIFEMFL